MRAETDFRTNLRDGEKSEIRFKNSHNVSLAKLGGKLVKNPDEQGVDLLYCVGGAMKGTWRPVAGVELKTCFSTRAPIANGRKKNFIMQATKKSGQLAGCLSSKSDFFVKHMEGVEIRRQCVFGGAVQTRWIQPRTYYFRTKQIKMRFYSIIQARTYNKTTIYENGERTNKTTYTIPISEFDDIDLGRENFEKSLHAFRDKL